MGPQWELRTLKDLEEFRKTLKGRSFLTSYAFRFIGVETGSILLIWSVPRTCSDFLISSLDSRFQEQCQVEGVTIDGVDLEEYRRQHRLSDPDAVSPKYVNEFSERLMWASGEGCLEDVVFLLSTEVEVNSRGQWRERTALMLASEGGHLDVVRELLKAQADVNVQDEWGWTALMLASYSGHTDTVSVLVTAGAQVDKEYGVTALMLASVAGHTDTVHVLLSAGAHVDLQNKDGWTALMQASFIGRTDTVCALLSAGANIDMQDGDGMTALMWASYHGHTDTVRVLLSGAQIDLQDEYGNTALMEASGSGCTDSVHVLLSAGAQVDLQNKHGETALIRAVRSGRTETVIVLVEAGPDVNLQEKTSGRSAVFYGAEYGDPEIVKILIQGGANLRLKDKDGVTADEVAEVHGHQAVCEELRKNVRADRKPLSQAVRDRVLATGQLLRTLYKSLEEKIFRTQKKELARITTDDPEIPLPSTPGRKGVRDPWECLLQEYTDMPRSDR